MTYKMISTAERGWFFVQNDQAQVKKHNQEGPIIQRVAAWALTEDDLVIGLVGGSAHDGTGESKNEFTRLWAPTRLANGEYKHFNDLTQAELAALADQNRPNRQNI